MSLAVPAWQAAVRPPAFLQKLPLRFEANRGQGGTSASFLARGPNYTLTLSAEGSSLSWVDTARGRGARIHMRLAGARPGVRLEGADPLATRTSYFRGSDPASWLADVPVYGRVNYGEVYPGVGLTFYGKNGALEYDFVVQPGADPGKIRLQVGGARRVRLDSNGNLVLSTEAGDVRWEKPEVYQTASGARRPVAGRFRLAGRNTVAFVLGPYDRSRALVIDPVLSFATYFGASGNDAARAVAADSSGNMYIAGYTTSQDLPVTSGALQAAYGGQTTNFMTGDAFVAKFSPTGAPLYVTYLGGKNDDVALGLAIDKNGNAWVTGYTTSGDFPVKNPFQPTFHGSGGNARLITGDVFVAGINAAGNQLLYGSYLGGTLDDAGTAITLDAGGNLFLTGTTLSVNFPVSARAAQPTRKGAGGQPTLPDPANYQAFNAGDAFVVKLDPTKTLDAQMVYGTYVGGSLDDAPLAIAVDASGYACIAGYTLSRDFPVTPGALQSTYKEADIRNNRFYNLGDGFVAKIAADGSQIAAATYLGGRGDDGIFALALDASGNVYVTGVTDSSDFPVTQDALQTRYGGPTLISNADQLLGDAFVTKLKANLTGLVFSTFLGGDKDDAGAAIAVDVSGSVYVAGLTNSATFPLSSDAAQNTFGGAGAQNANQLLGDGFLARLNSTGAALSYSTFLGGNADDVIAGMAIDGAGNVYVTGSTVSTNFPVTSGAYQSSYHTIGDAAQGRIHGHAFAARYSGFPVGTAPAISLTAITNAANYVAGKVSPGMVFTAFGAGIGPNDLAYATFVPDGHLLTTSTGGTRFLFGNTPAPMVYASATQSSGIVPYDVAGKSTVEVRAEYNGQTSNPITLQVAPSVPGLFSLDQSGQGPGAVFNQDNTLNSATNGARQGELIQIFGTGEGQTDPAVVDGLVTTWPAPRPVLPLTVTIGGVPAVAEYFGEVPKIASGVFQVNVRIPMTVINGVHEVKVTIGNATSQPGLTVVVGP
jgi:uncharacterized protein (TIGR03437 family)